MLQHTRALSSRSCQRIDINHALQLFLSVCNRCTEPHCRKYSQTSSCCWNATSLLFYEVYVIDQHTSCCICFNQALFVKIDCNRIIMITVKYLLVHDTKLLTPARVLLIFKRLAVQINKSNWCCFTKFVQNAK